jgi:hypothetical protein
MQAMTTVMDLGTPGEQAAHHLIHAYCRRRTGGSKPGISDQLDAIGLA